MIKTIKAMCIYKRMRKPICRKRDGGWYTEYAVIVNRNILVACHESRTKCGVRLKVITNAPAFIHAIRKAKN